MPETRNLKPETFRSKGFSSGVYLCLEFGCDDTPDSASRVSEDWPFHLTEVGSVVVDGTPTSIFTFTSDGTEFYAIAGRSLNFFEVAGVDVANLKRQLIGGAWIGSKNPIDLNTSKGEHPVVPGLPERKKRFDDFAQALRPGEGFKVLEGLFLEVNGQYLGLIRFGDEQQAQIIGNRITLRNVPFPKLGAWRRLSIGIGKLIENGRLG